ncbi:MAG: LuxR C-terminal-related transcriptional regulator [Bryobacteraceae bacterium]
MACEECALWRKRIAELEAELERAKEGDASAEERFRQLADCTPLMIWMSGPDAMWTYCNRAWLEFRGRSMAEESGNGWTEGLHPDDRDICVETYLKSFTARQPYRIQYRLQRADGEYCWVEDRGLPRLDGTGRFAGFNGAAADIGERRHPRFTPDAEALRIVLTLTERERQVLVLVAEGKSTRRAARQLGISYKTVESHRSRILEKLGVHETASMVRYAIRAGLIAP